MANSVEDQIRQLYRMIDEARSTFSNTARIDREKALDILDEIKQKYPTEVEQARKVMAQRSELLNQAQAEAERMRSEAQADAEKLRSDAQAEAEQMLRNAEAEAARKLEANEIKRRLEDVLQQRTEQYRKEAAEQRRKDEEAARERVAATERQCAELRKTVDTYCSEALRRTEETISGALGEVRKAREGFTRITNAGNNARKAASGPYDAQADAEEA